MAYRIKGPGSIDLQAFLDSSPVGIGWSRSDGRIEYINNKFTEMFGYTLADIPNVEDWYRLAYPDEEFRRTVVMPWAREVTAARDSHAPAPALEAPVACKDGTVRHVIITASWVGDTRLVNFSDITERWVAERREHARHAVLELIAKDAPLPQTLEAIVNGIEAENATMLCSILLLDRDSGCLRTGAAPSIPGFFSGAIDGIAIGPGVGSCGTAAYTRQRVVVDDIQAHPYWAEYKELAAKAGLASCWSEPVLSSKGQVLGTFAIYHRQPSAPKQGDLQLIGHAANLASVAIEHRQTQDELEHRAHTDFLTELANRRTFLELAEGELNRTLRYGKTFSLMMLDIDHFKAVNDSRGHKAGDAVLKKLAGVMLAVLREVDVVGRIGGEEFAIILPETSVAKAKEAAERLRSAIANTDISVDDGPPLRITVSIGIATLTDNATDIDMLLRQADEALYTAKHDGRNRICAAAVRKSGRRS